MTDRQRRRKSKVQRHQPVTHPTLLHPVVVVQRPSMLERIFKAFHSAKSVW